MIADVITSCIICYVVCVQGIPNCSLQLVGLKLRMYGAQVTGSFDSKVTHVILDGRLLQFSFFSYCNGNRACRPWKISSSTSSKILHKVIWLYTIAQAVLRFTSQRTKQQLLVPHCFRGVHTETLVDTLWESSIAVISLGICRWSLCSRYSRLRSEQRFI